MRAADTTPAEIEAALNHIPADLARDEWARVGMAIKSELGDAGFDLFDAWSARGGNYDQRGARDTWRSIKATGGVRVGTLFHLARQHGYRPAANGAHARHLSGRANRAHGHDSTAPEDPQICGSSPTTGPDAEAQEREATERRHQAAAARAHALFEKGSKHATAPYLAHKGLLGGYGARSMPDGRLLVPMRAGASPDSPMVNMQIIRPKVGGGFEKRFLAGGRKSGTLFLMGAFQKGTPALLVCEGFATGASLFEAMNHGVNFGELEPPRAAVAIAWDAGNLRAVAMTLRATYPDRWILICGDDDRGTKGNPGRRYAEAAAKAVGGLAVFPAGLKDGASDWNDLHQAAGLDAVRAQIEAALQAAEAPRQGLPPDLAEKIDPEPDTQADRFRIDESAVWFDPPDSGDGGGAAPIKVCGRLRALALARDAHDGSGALLLEFDGHFGAGRRWLMPLAALAGDGTAYRAELLALGFVAPVDAKRRSLLTMYLQSRMPKARVRLTDKTGWHARCFVLPRETLGDDAADKLMFQSESPVESPFAQRGRLPDWREQVARPCAGNTRLAFSVCVAFAGPALALSGIADGGGFHFHGDSSAGKTTLLRTAASVWGAPDYKGQWRATANGLESLAASHSDGVLILDELAQLDPREAGESAYLLANGVGKARAGRTGAARPRLTWRLLTLSAGEIDLSEHMAEAGRRMRAGQELRLASVPADAGAQLGVFEALHEFEAPGELAQHLARAAEATHGTAGRAWLEYLTANFEDAARELRERIEAIALQIVPEAASGQVQRVGRRFALIGAAGELATAAGLTGWREGEATHAARRCFNAWIESRPGGIGMSEDAQMLRQIRGWFAAHGDARFVDWDRADDDHAPRTMHRAGWRKRRSITGLHDANGDLLKASADEWFVVVDVFRAEVCKGFNDRAALRLLKALGHLHTENKGLTCSASPPGAHRAQVVRVKASILQESDE